MNMNGSLDMLKAYKRDLEMYREEVLLLRMRVVELESEISTMKAMNRSVQRP